MSTHTPPGIQCDGCERWLRRGVKAYRTRRGYIKRLCLSCRRRDALTSPVDTEGVTERGPRASGDHRREGASTPRDESSGSKQPARSVTSPVDTAPGCTHPEAMGGVTDEGVRFCQLCGALLPRGYVEHGPGGPQAVYHAETPDAYLEHGDK